MKKILKFVLLVPILNLIMVSMYVNYSIIQKRSNIMKINGIQILNLDILYKTITVLQNNDD